MKKLRKGFTTGTCAAAAAKAATLLLRGERRERVSIALPSGERVSLGVAQLEMREGVARACVVKDAGDDPDVTHGALICAEVRRRSGREVVIGGGRGVGVVTKPGLAVPVGEAAINPVPREMIRRAVREAMPEGGVEVLIEVPRGKELARRTMNPKLGIKGGISILGTSGRVEPWSESAFMRSLVPQIDVALAAGFTEVVLTPGRIGEKNALRRRVPEDAVVQCGNYVGYMLEQCAERGIEGVLLFGHVGKLVKVAAGIFHTHSRVADARLETLAAYAAEGGAPQELVAKLLRSATAEEAVSLLLSGGFAGVLNRIAERASLRAGERVEGKLKTGTILINLKGEVVGSDAGARRIRWGRYLL
ncbi:MAG: cobalt-precorrin-5B (C(1))-methyltransferase [Euryarchaeota archaeon]|nr:cobalt-precorrin-5B (C(1))-methyltransferase [Euryarchaeota archaeon]